MHIKFNLPDFECSVSVKAQVHLKHRAFCLLGHSLEHLFTLQATEKNLWSLVHSASWLVMKVMSLNELAGNNTSTALGAALARRGCQGPVSRCLFLSSEWPPVPREHGFCSREQLALIIQKNQTSVFIIFDCLGTKVLQY